MLNQWVRYCILSTTAIFISSICSAQIPGLQWARAFNGTTPSTSYPTAVATDPSGNVFTIGTFQLTFDFDPGPGVFLLTAAAGSDIFISKLDAAGDFVWAVKIDATQANSITVDGAGNPYITGAYAGTVDFDPGAGTTNLTGGGAFALKLNANGTFNWAKRIGNGQGNSMAIDASNNLIIAGDFTGSSDFDPGAGITTLTSAGGSDIFVSKFLLDGTFVWAKSMGGLSTDLANGVDTDASGNVYTTGGFSSAAADFDPGAPINTLTSAGSDDIYVSKLDAAGNYVSAVRIGFTGSERANSLTIDGAGNVLLTGQFTGTVDFDPGGTVNNLTSAGSTDIFVVKLTSALGHAWSRNMGGVSQDVATSVATDAAGNVYTTGFFYSTADFDPGATVFNMVSFTGNQDAFISKLDASGNFSWALKPNSPNGYETQGVAITLSGLNDILITGWFESTVDFDPGSCTYNVTSTGDETFIMKLSLTSSGCIKPTITGFSPANGNVGTIVTINGTNFNTTPANNIVYFGATRAVVSASTSTQLTVSVPTGATFEPITVTVNGKTGSSSEPFITTFADGGVINSCAFAPMVQYSSGNFGYGIATGDIDGDGKVDMVVSNGPTSVVQIYRNTSVTGTIDANSFATSVNLPVGLNTYGIDVADVDGDGKLDILAAGLDDKIITIYRNISSPGNLTAASFAARVDLPTFSSIRPINVQAVDLDGDGKTDVVSNTEGKLSIWQNIGTAGTLSAASFATRIDINSNAWSMTVTDLDVDGKPDIIVSPAISSVISVFRNISTPGTLTAASFATNIDYPVGAWGDFLTTGDLDGDHKPEILSSSWPSATFTILQNSTSPGTINATSFTSRTDMPTGSEPRGLVITDFDGDGKNDVILALQIASQVMVFKNISTPGPLSTSSFSPSVNFTAGGNLRGVTGADFDGDGKPDIAVANWSGPLVSVLRNTVSSLPPLTGSSFSPASGPIGSLVTITGTNFSTTLLNNTVKFNGVVATVISATSTSIDTTVPVGATTGPISVQVGCNTMVTFSNFTVTTPPPLSSPALVWAKQIGGSSTDLGLSTAIDAAGNVYTTGAFVGTVDFDPGAGVTNLTSNGSFDVFITKFDAAGNLKWAKSVGAVPDERGQGITVDPSGNVYVTGYFFNTVDFDPDAVATFPLTSYGSRDVFILKLDGLGNFVWAKRMGSTSTDEGKSIVLDHSGNILTTGYFNSSGRFDPGNSSTTITSSGLTDIFVSKLDPSGNYLWSKKMGGTFFDQGYALDVDGSDNVLISGFFQRTADFDPGAGTFNLVSNANSNDIFISKLDASGNFVWAKQIGGPGDEIANSIAVDASDNVISTGRMYFDFSGTPIDFDPGAGVFNLTPVAGNSSSFPDIFISKLNSSGTFVWAKQMSGVSYEEAFSVDVDISGNVYVTGDFVGTVDFDPGPSSFDLTSSGYDIFVSKLDASGNFGWVESFGGTGFDVGYGIAVNSSGFIATTGSMSATGDFAPGSCLYNLTSNGSDDIFIQKLTQSTIPPPIITSFSPSSGPAGTVVVITGANFDPIPSNNIVRFNGLLTTVSASSGTSITTIVPVGALDGTISVDVICSSGTSPTPFDVTGACNIPLYERSALTDLYNSTNGAGWTNSTNWNSADESTWHGITVSGCRVSQIDLSANQLNGALPATIANLGSLQILKLFDNALTGSLPATIGNQTALTQLQLQHNSLTGVIPSSLATCTALQNINLEGNQFSGTIPSFLGSLSGLSSINLGHNGFSGNIPTTLGSLPLTFLSLAGNALTGNIPTQLGNLSSLVLLDLSDNQLTGTLPVQLGQLSSLVSLQLFSNQFSGSYLTQLENLANLQELNLSQNQLTGPVVSNFANMPVLRILLLNDNQLDGAFSSSISSLTALQTVSLARNHFTSIPVIGSYDLFVENNNLDFASLEPNVASTVNFSYDPQAKLPPGGSIFFTVGGTLIIPFTTGGTSNSYQWYNMGIPVPGATSLSLSKPGMTQADAGIYYLQVTNSVVTGITLESVPYLVFTDPCSAITPTYGDLDVPFDPQIDVPTSVSAIGIQSTGKILMAANNSVINGTAFHGIVRFNTDGTLDNSFNTIDYYENVMLVQVDDKIVTVDASYVSTYLIRLDEDGNSDGSFNPSINTDIVYALGLQSDGNILVSHNDSGTDRITRLLPDGSTDPSFTAPQDLPSNVIKVQSNGFILAGGFFPDGIVRLDASGNIDPGFNGYADGEVTDIAIQPDGKIILVGSFQYVNGVPHRGIARLNIDGSLDNTFRAIGISDAVSLENYPAKIALQGNGQIIIAGIFSSVSGTGRVNLAKLNSDGTIDCTFDPELSTNFPISSLQLQANGKILIGGDFTTYDGVTRNGFARVNNLQNSSCVPASQRAALVALYNSTNGAAWTNKTNWLNADESTWFGVTVAGCNIDLLNLDNNNLVGTIPPETGNLTGLRYLVLNKNKLTGTIPMQLGNILTLESIDLSDNNLSGSIPKELGNLSALGFIDLAVNQLTGPIPTELGNLSALQFLRFSDNVLTGSIPVSFGNLNNLFLLDLSKNQLTGTIPSQLANDLLLKYLVLNSNKLTGTIPVQLGNLNVLQEINLGTNQLTGGIPISFGNLTSLTDLSLYDNQLTGPIPPEIGNDLQLKFINLYSNQLSGSIPPELGDLSLLQELWIFSNQLTGTLPIELSQLTQLKTLGIADNLLTGTLPVEYELLTNLEVFQINDNSFTGAVPPEYLAWTKIKDLYLSRNQLTAFPTFPPALITHLAVDGNLLDFGDLESSMGTTGYVYSPQASLPPGGSLNINAGSPLSIPFTTSGTANLYQWYKNGVLITGATSATFLIPTTTLTDAGSYTVSVTSTIVTGLTLTSLPYVVTMTPVIVITLQPSDFIACDGQIANFNCGATGTTNITYQWQFSVSGLPATFADITNGGNYSGATTTTLSVNSTGSFGVGRYRCRINGDLAAEVITNDEGLFVNPIPPAPGATGNSGCSPSSLTLSASGASNGEYKWYTLPTGGTAIAGAVNSTYITPSLSVTTSFYVSIKPGSCESPRTSVVATIISLPSAPTVTPGSACAPSSTVTLNASGGTSGQYRWYTVATGGSPIAGQTNSSFITPVLSSTTTYFVSIHNGTCESLRTSVQAQIISCTPQITAASLTTQVGGQTSVDIAPLVTTFNNPIDVASIKVKIQPLSGAMATVNSGVLNINYANISFAGTDRLTIEACDVASHCAQQDITILVAGDIVVYNALSPNGDTKNEVFYIQFIDLLPNTKNNKVTIFDRTGSIVFEVDNYDNANRVFRGLNSSGSELPSGTYYYKIDFDNQSKTGFIALRK